MGTLLVDVPALGTVVFGVKGLAQKSAEVSDLTDGEIQIVRGIGKHFFAEKMSLVAFHL